MLFTNTVSAREIQRNYKKIFQKVKRTKQPIVVISDNTPQAAIVSMEQLREYEHMRAFSVLDDVWVKNRGLDTEKEEAFITHMVKEVRQEMYEQRSSGSR